MASQQNDDNPTPDGNTSRSFRPQNKERRHSGNNDGFKTVDQLSRSLTKTWSTSPVQDDSNAGISASTSGREQDDNISDISRLLVDNVVGNGGEDEPKNNLRSQNPSSYGQKASSSTGCANFYKLSTSELDSSEELAAPISNELSQASASHNSHNNNNNRNLQLCANQRTGDKTNNSWVEKTPESRDRTAVCAAKGKKPRANLIPSPIGGFPPPTSGLGWQSSKHTVKERLEHMCLNTSLADVYFVVSSNDGATKERVPAHKFVLSIGSPVFDAMFRFDDSQNESTHLDGGAQEIELIDVEPKALEALLTFLYTDEVSISPDSVMAILYTARKYGVPALEQQCVDFLKENLNSENVFMLLSQARFFDEPKLTETCLSLIDRDINEIIQTGIFMDVDHQALCSVLKRDSLRIDELPLFQALVKWSIEECKRRDLAITPENQRAVLGNILSLVRYNQMSVEEFAEHVAMSKLLTDSEIVSVFLYFTLSNVGGGSSHLERLPIHFPVSPRRRFIGKEMSINRFQRIEASWGYSGTPDRIKFTVDAPIFVLGFGLYGSMNDSAEYSVTIEIINFGSGQILAHHETSFMADGTPSIFRVMFKEPVEIASGLTYIASSKLKGAESHYGTKGLRRIVRQMAPDPRNPSSTTASCLTDSAITFQFSYAAGNNNGTSVDDGQIPEIVFCQKF